MLVSLARQWSLLSPTIQSRLRHPYFARPPTICRVGQVFKRIARCLILRASLGRRLLLSRRALLLLGRVGVTVSWLDVSWALSGLSPILLCVLRTLRGNTIARLGRVSTAIRHGRIHVGRTTAHGVTLRSTVRHLLVIETTAAAAEPTAAASTTRSIVGGLVNANWTSVEPERESATWEGYRDRWRGGAGSLAGGHTRRCSSRR